MGKAEIRWQVSANLFATIRPALSLRITSQCFCMNSTSGRDRVHGNVVNAVADLGGRDPGIWNSDLSPRLIGCHVCAPIIRSEQRPPPRWR